MSRRIIILENVSWAYTRAREWTLKNIDIAIGEGEYVAIMGENGAGKTSFCRLINGLIPHSLPGKLLGTVTIDGIRTTDSSVARLAGKTGTVFEDPETQLFTASTAGEVAFALENLLMPPDEIRAKVRWALEIAGLSHYADSAPAALSGGQKQRLAIACALAMATKILVLDEPCSQLDPDGARDVLLLIRKLSIDKRLTVVMATDSIETAAEFAGKICVLKNGRIAAFDTPRRVLADERLLAETSIRPPLSGTMNCRVSAQPPTEQASVLELRHVCYWYDPGRIILDDINLSIPEGAFIAITGQNGSGKTTMLKNISGLLRPSSGSIVLRGRDTARMNITEIAGEIGFVMQDPDRQLFESTVYNEIAFTLKRRKTPKQAIREKVEAVLHMTSLADKQDAFPPALGRADRVKIIFASMLATGSRILMLDEPLAGQDAKGCHLIMNTLANLHQQGYTILLVTHNINIAAEYAQRIITMRDGSINL